MKGCSAKRLPATRLPRGGALAGLAALMLAVPAHAGTVTVTEGETARFQITVTPKSGNDGSGRVRLWYDTDGGTAVEGEDYETAHSWAHNVRAWTGSPVTVSVKTFEDGAVEGDETFGIRIRRVEVRATLSWGASYWRSTPNSKWNISGVTSATIIDATPQPQGSDGHESYEDEKYGPGYTGTVYGE